jgi:hypothetical protein
MEMEEPNPFPRVLVEAEVEVNGARVSTKIMVDGVAWDHAEYVREEVKRQLRRKLADEILKHFDVRFTVQS